jgi:hypothetical protein
MNSTAQNICPNYQTCLLVNPPYIVLGAEKKEMYMSMYCRAGELSWSSCKRYITKKALSFCPDFVLPDSPETPDQIINEFDQRNNIIK